MSATAGSCTGTRLSGGRTRDMTADELHAAIEKAEEKRRELVEQQVGAALSGRAPSILPRAAELYRRQVALGLEGDPQATLKARVFLRDWFGGKIRLEPLPDGGLMAHWNQNVGALCKGLGSCGSGGVLWSNQNSCSVLFSGTCPRPHGHTRYLRQWPFAHARQPEGRPRRNVAGAAAAVVGRERPSFELGISRRHRFGP